MLDGTEGLARVRFSYVAALEAFKCPPVPLWLPPAWHRVTQLGQPLHSSTATPPALSWAPCTELSCGAAASKPSPEPRFGAGRLSGMKPPLELVRE